MKSNSVSICIGLVAATVAFAGSLQAAVIFTVRDTGPSLSSTALTITEGKTTGNSALGASFGNVSSSIAAAPGPITYTLTNVDFTSVGGTATDEIVFTVSFAANGANTVLYNTIPNGNIFVGPNGVGNQIDVGETLTATVAFVSTTFAGGASNLDIRFDQMVIGGWGTGEVMNLIHDSGTISRSYNVNSSNIIDMPLSTAFTQEPTTGTVNLQRYDVLITAIPEPSIALLGGLGLFGLLRRRR